MRRENPFVRAYIVKNVSHYPDSIASRAAREFGLSRNAIAGYMQRLIEDGTLLAEGKTKARRYRLRKLVDIAFYLSLSKNVEESVVWQYKILPEIRKLPSNIIDICHYGFTEMLNNAIDHSASPDVLINYEQTAGEIRMTIIDYGIGIFEKIQQHFKLPDPRSALLELSKGKLTSDKENHAGEGIFFTSRMFDHFTIRSGELMYVKQRDESDDGWLFTVKDHLRDRRGTAIRMIISTKAQWTTKEVFKKFQGNTVGFRKTHIPIKLGEYPGEQLVSRSQAKRILARFENFSEILLDFSDVETIGQAFADEIFRVFKNAHPEIEIVAIHTSSDVRRMIDHVQVN